MPQQKKKVAELFAYMDQTRAALFATARDINPTVAMIRPREDVWSTAEILAHLALVEDGVGRLTSKTIKAAREQGIGPDQSDESFMSNLDEYRVVENPDKRQAPSGIVPDIGPPVEESLAVLEQSRARLKEALTAAGDIDLCSITRPHPVLGDLNLYQWALFVAQHEERHRRQIEKTCDQVTELAAESAPIV